MSYLRTVTKGGHQYRQLVESLWDKKAKRSRTHVLQHLGPVVPVYGRGTAPVTLPLDPPSFGLLATQIMMGSLTAAQVVDTIREMGQEIPSGDLAAVGIRYDLGGKNLVLLLWLAPPSTHPRPAPSARPPLSKAGPAPPIPTRSRGKRG